MRGQSSGFAEPTHQRIGPVQGLYSDSAGRLWISSLKSGVICVEDPASDQPRI